MNMHECNLPPYLAHDLDGRKNLKKWQKIRLHTIHAGRMDYGEGNRNVTVLAYLFCAEDSYDEAFSRIECAVRETWLHCGTMKTVLVVNVVRPCVESFAAAFPNVKIQVEKSLVPGRIFTMSADMNGRLHERFSTPYVLIVQNDGFPLRSGLDDFVGKWDFIGAPYVRPMWWKQFVCRMMNCWVQNGGFSLRSHDICEQAAFYWNRKYAALGDCVNASEDMFYTQFLPLHERSFRRRFRLAPFSDSISFSYDAIVPIVAPTVLPFGFHGEKAFKKLLGLSCSSNLIMAGGV